MIRGWNAQTPVVNTSLGSLNLMNEGLCENCGSNEGYGIYCTDPKCGCGGELKYWHCKDCRHVTSFFHITGKGREVLRTLLGEKNDEEQREEKTEG